MLKTFFLLILFIVLRILEVSLWLWEFVIWRSCCWLGWQIVWFFSFGQVRPTEVNYYKSYVVALVGLYSWCLLPAAIYIAAENIGLLP